MGLAKFVGLMRWDINRIRYIMPTKSYLDVARPFVALGTPAVRH